MSSITLTGGTTIWGNNSDFTISDTSICEGEVSTITYTGTATSSGIYTWNFGVVSQSQQGPHTHTFSPAGNGTGTYGTYGTGGINPFSNTANTFVPTFDENLDYLNSQLTLLTKEEYDMWYNSNELYDKNFKNIFKTFIRKKKLSKIINY